MDILTGIYFLLYTFVITLSIERLMGVFFENRKTTQLLTISSYLLFFIFLSLAGLLQIPLFELFAVLTYFIIALNYEASIVKRIIAAVCSYLCIQMIQGIFLIITGAIPGSSDLLNTEIALLLFASGLTNYIIASLFRRFKNIKNSKMTLPASWISLLIIPIFSTTILAVMIIFLDYLPLIIVAAISIMAFLFTVISFYFQNSISKAYEDKLKTALTEKEKEYYFSQCQLMQESVDKVKSIHHDMKFHLTTARDYVANNKTNEATDYLNSLLGDIGKIESYSDTGNMAFDKAAFRYPL